MDVTQHPVVRLMRNVLHDRLGEFYDEDGEAVLMISSKNTCMTLLGVVVLCLVTLDLLNAPDVVLAKAEVLPNAYLNFSSSAMAMFGIRALIFVTRDLLSRFSNDRVVVGLILLCVG